MTIPLYQNNSYLTSFSSLVTACTPAPQPGQWCVILAETAFYPEGGGQPADHGTLGSVHVLDVQEKAGEIHHLTDGALAVGSTVEGKIDFARRLDHMQQHSGEHIVSGLLHRRFGWNNIGFHLGSELVTIDLDGPITPAQLAEVELAANRIICANTPVRLSYPDLQTLAVTDYRSKKPIAGQVRLVGFEDADLCACCGTHVAFTGEIGLIKCCGLQSYKGGVRIQMVSGERAVRLAQREHEQIAAISALLSAKQPDVVTAVENLQAAEIAARQRANEAISALLCAKAAAFGGAPAVLTFEPALAPDDLRRYALAICENGATRAAVYTGNDDAGYQYVLTGADAAVISNLHAAMKAALCCRGGGKGVLYQGSTAATRQAIEDFFRTND